MVTIPFLGIDSSEVTGNSELHILITAIAIIGTTITFFAPTYYRTKSSLARGLSETIRILESNDSHRARRMLYLKYQKNKQIEEEELKNSAEKVRNDLLMIQTMLVEKALAPKVFHSIYSMKIFRTIENYIKFMEEFHPSFQVELPIRKLFKKAYRWHKRDSADKATRKIDSRVEDLWDRIGF